MKTDFFRLVSFAFCIWATGFQIGCHSAGNLSKAPGFSPDCVPPAETRLYVNIHVASTTGNEMYCSVESRGKSSLLVRERILWTWEATENDLTGKVVRYAGTGNVASNITQSFEQPKYVLLPPLAASYAAQEGRLWGEFYLMKFSLGDSDGMLRSFRSGHLKLSLSLQASVDLHPMERKIDFSIDLPLREGTNWSSELPISTNG